MMLAKYIYMISLLLAFVQVFSLPINEGSLKKQKKSSVMDQIYEEIQGYINKKRDEIQRNPSMQSEGGKEIISIDDIDEDRQSNGNTDTATFSSIYPSFSRKSKIPVMGKKYTQKSEVEKQLVNVTVKIPIFQASDKTKHLVKNDSRDTSNQTVHNTTSKGDSNTTSKGDSNTTSKGDSNMTSKGDSNMTSKGDSNMTSKGDIRNQTKYMNMTNFDESSGDGEGELKNETALSVGIQNNTVLLTNDTNQDIMSNSSDVSLNVTKGSNIQKNITQIEGKSSNASDSNGNITQFEGKSSNASDSNGYKDGDGGLDESSGDFESKKLSNNENPLQKNSTVNLTHSLDNRNDSKVNLTHSLNSHGENLLADNNKDNLTRSFDNNKDNSTRSFDNHSMESSGDSEISNLTIGFSNDGEVKIKNDTANLIGQNDVLNHVNTDESSGDSETASSNHTSSETDNVNHTSTEVRNKRHYYWDHNQNNMEMHNNPSYHGGDFMHGGGHDEFHNIDEHGERLDLGQVDLATQPQLNYHEEPHVNVHESPHYHNYEPHSEYTDVHNEPQYYSQQVHHEPHYHRNYYNDEPHYQHTEHHLHDNHQEHFHEEPHYLHNEVHIHHNHENFHDEPEEHHSGESENYHHRKFHRVRVKLHGPGKTPDEWHDQEQRENEEMPVGENDELNNYDTGAGFFQLDENGGDVEITSMHKTGTKVHMGGGQFSIIRDPWRYHSAFAGMLHPHENLGHRMGGGGGSDGVQQFHQHFTYINNNRNENHKVQNLVHHEHEPEHDHHEHHYEEHHDDHHKHHDHKHHGDGDGHEGDHDDDHHHHHHEEDEDHHHYEEHKMDDHHLFEHPDVDQGYGRDIKLYPGDDTQTVKDDTGTPPIDNMREDRAPSGVKRTSDIMRDVTSITPKDAHIPGDVSGVKRDDIGIDKRLNEISLEEPIDVNGPKNAFFKGIQQEKEVSSSAVESFEHEDEAGFSGDVEEAGFRRMKTKFENHAESKEPDILNMQQFHVNGPSNPEPWVTRELVMPISPMVMKRDFVRERKTSKLSDRASLIYRTFIKNNYNK